MVSPSQMTEASEVGKGEGFKHTDWYFSKKTL
jgi:hypothetical protein